MWCTEGNACQCTLRFLLSIPHCMHPPPPHPSQKTTTGVLAPVGGPSRDTYTLLLDQAGRKASWTLELCDVPAYTASHLHTVRQGRGVR